MIGLRIILAGALLAGLARAQSSPTITLTIQGEVGTPGPVEIDGQERWPLIRALAKAGGLNECAAWDRIHIQRKNQTLTVGRYTELPLEDGDVVIVERLRATLVHSMQAPQKIDLTHRSLPGLLGTELASYRGFVVHASREGKNPRWNEAEFFDGTVTKRIELEDDDIIVLSKRETGKTIEATLAGEVRAPGMVHCGANSSLLDALTQAKGFAPNADAERAVLVRGGREQVVTNMLGLATVKLRPLDVVRIIPVANIEIFVAGSVQNKGRYLVPLNSRDQLGDAIKAAGGARANAAIHRIRLWRSRENGESGMLDLDQGSTSLLSGDTLWLDSKHCNLTGVEYTSGQFLLSGGDTLATVVRAAGVDTTRQTKAKVLRASDIKIGSYRWETYDLTQPETISKVTIEDGDYIHVPASDSDHSLPIRELSIKEPRSGSRDLLELLDDRLDVGVL